MMLTRRERTPLRKLMLLGAMAGAGALVEDTATGNPLTFITDVSKPLKSLVANFLPVQASGTPFPENILPITGWDAVNVFHAGKNLFNSDRTRGTPSDTSQSSSTKRTFDESEFVTGLSSQNDYIANRISSYDLTNGVLTFTATRSTYGVGFPVSLVAGSYTLSCIFSGRLITIATYDFDGTYTGRINLDSTGKFTIPQNCMAVVIFFGEENIEAQAKEIQLEVGNTASTYEPYQTPSEYSPSFPSTIYGGYVDIVTGEVWRTWKGVDLGLQSWSKRSENQNRQVWEAYFSDAKFGSDGSGYIAYALSSQFSLTTQSGVWSVGKFAPSTASNNKVFIFVVPAESYASASECKEGMTGIQLVYELAEPVLITTLTPQQINAIKGNNTVWSDANGNCEVTYLKKG